LKKISPTDRQTKAEVPVQRVLEIAISQRYQAMHGPENEDAESDDENFRD